MKLSEIKVNDFFISKLTGEIFILKRMFFERGVNPRFDLCSKFDMFRANTDLLNSHFKWLCHTDEIEMDHLNLGQITEIDHYGDHPKGLPND